MTHTPAAEASKPSAFRQGFLPLVRALRDFLATLWSGEGRRILTFLTVAVVLVICATVVAQVALNAWIKPFYDAIQQRVVAAFGYLSLVFCVVAGSRLVLIVARVWL